MMLAEAQQNGWESRGFHDYYLADQESRVRYFHEVLNDYIEAEGLVVRWRLLTSTGFITT